MKVFQYIVILHPTEDERKAGSNSMIVVDLTTCLALNEHQVVILAARRIPEAHLKNMDRIEVAVRPF